MHKLIAGIIMLVFASVIGIPGFCTEASAKNFRVTACSEVDPQDADVFQNCLQGGGFTLDARYNDGQINLSSFNPDKELDYIYNASHGSEYYICFSGGSSGMTGSEFTGNKVKNLVTASCDTVSNQWSGHPGFSAVLKSVLGYHLVCYNDCALHAAQSFGQAIVSLDPSTDTAKIVEAWKKANTSFDAHAAQAWAACTASGYTSGGGKESGAWYSTSSFTPSKGSRTVKISDKVSYTFPVERTASSLPVLSAEPEANLDLKASPVRQKNLDSGAIRAEFKDCTLPCDLNASQAIETASAFIKENGGLPEDAVALMAIPVVQIDLSGKKEVINYFVSFARCWMGLEISGRTGDSINLLIGKNGVISYSRLWRNISDNRNRFSDKLLPADEALAKAADAISHSIRNGSVCITTAKLGYHSPSYQIGGQVDLVPCYHFYDTRGMCFNVDAVSGELLK
ncbi:MAG: hypothetical protein PHW04_14845 [Candidatus Wallbacteria bacterium]|nr:hypothetical protein [Candidatus Wallbacteria bacterium]